MMYCNALGFIPAFANVVQNVWRKVCGVITFGNATFCVLLYFLTSPRNILDLNAEFSDENGYLLTDYAQPDGIHLTVSGYNKWVSYLCTHTPYSKNNPYQPGSTYYLSEEMQSQLADLP